MNTSATTESYLGISYTGRQIVTAGSTAPLWSSSLLSIGEGIQLPDGRVYEIAALNQATQKVYITSEYSSTSFTNQAYQILPMQGYIKSLANRAAELVSSYGTAIDSALAGKFSDGTESAPGISYVADTDTGIRRVASGTQAIVANGADVVTVSPTGLSVAGKLTTNGLKEDASGNLGIGVTPSAWYASFGTQVVQFAASGSVYGLDVSSADRRAGLMNNAFINSSGNYSCINTGHATQYEQKAGSHTWLIAPSGTAGNPITFTQAMTLDASGNLLVGTTGVSGGSGRISSHCVDSGNAAIFSSPSGKVRIRPYIDATNGAFIDSSNGDQSGYAPLSLVGSGVRIAAMNGGLAATFDTSGNLLVGQPIQGVSDSNSFSLSPTNALYANHASGSLDGRQYIYFAYGGGGIGSITQSGTTTVAYNTTSDHRLKTNVRPANAARFMDIEFVDFEWVDGRHDCGVIADQLQTVYPDLVLGEKDATEVRTIEITPAVPAVTEHRLVSAAIPAVQAVEARDAVEASPAEYATVTTDEVVIIDGVETIISRIRLVEVKPAVAARDAVVAVEAVPAVEAVYETVEITPATTAVTEEQEFPVYQQVNYIGLIGRMGTRVQQHQREIDAQAQQLQQQADLITTLIERLGALESLVQA
jgi:hypothetical protein